MIITKLTEIDDTFNKRWINFPKNGQYHLKLKDLEPKVSNLEMSSIVYHRALMEDEDKFKVFMVFNDKIMRDNKTRRIFEYLWSNNNNCLVVRAQPLYVNKDHHYDIEGNPVFNLRNILYNTTKKEHVRC